MTMAMQAVKTVSGPKVLRIGVIQGGRIIEERVIRNRDTVSVGTTEKNTFTLVAPEFPSHFDLFQMVGGTYKLVFTAGMDGRIAMAQGVQSLAQLKQSGQATQAGNLWQLTLNEQCRGKVTIGDITFLFQFVAPPPPQPKPQLPAAIKAGWIKNIDWTYNACMAFFLVMAFSGIAYVEYLFDPEIEDNFALDVRTVTLVAPPQINEPPPPEQHPEQATNEPSNEPAPTQQPQQQAHPSPQQQAAQQVARAEAAATRAAAAAERAASAAAAALAAAANFSALTGALDTGAGSAQDRLANGGLMQGSVDALRDTGGVQNGGGGPGVRRTGLAANAAGVGGGGGLGRSGVAASGGDNVGSGGSPAVERAPRGNLNLGGGNAEDGDGQLDASRVAGLIRGQVGGIRSCYERALRNNPTLSGRVTVRFTIGTTGRVTGSPSADGLDSNPEVGSCISGIIRRLVFPSPDGGSVTFSFPFNFSPGG